MRENSSYNTIPKEQEIYRNNKKKQKKTNNIINKI